MSGSKTVVNCASGGEMAVEATLKERQRLYHISELERLLRRVAKVPHSSKPYQPGHDLCLLETASKEICNWLHKCRIGIEEEPTSELGSGIMKVIVNAALDAINGDGGIVGCMNVLDTLYQFMWNLNENLNEKQTIEREAKRSSFVSAYSQLGILFATHLLEDLFESISDCAHKVGREELLYIQMLLRRWKSQLGVIDEVVVDELMGTLPPLSPGMMKEVDSYARKDRELLKYQKCKSAEFGTDQTASSSTSLSEYLPSYLLMGPMRGECLRYNVSMNKSAEDWKRRGERRPRDQESHSKLGQGWNRLDDKVKAIPDYSSWGINGWELLPPRKSSSNELVGLVMESQHLDTPPPLGGSEKLQLKPDHHNRFKCAPQLSQTRLRKSRCSHGVHSKGYQDDGGGTPVVPSREGYENVRTPTRLGQSGRPHMPYSKEYEDGDTSTAVPLGGHEHSKRVKLKQHDEYSSPNGDIRRSYF